MRIFWSLLLLALIAYGLTGLTQIRPGERAVVRRFGRVLEHKPEPGLHVGLPWGMDQVDRVAVDRVQTLTFGFNPDEDPTTSAEVQTGQLVTGDHNLINLQVVINYRVKPEELEDYVLHQDHIEGLLARTVESSLVGWVAGQKVDDVLLNGKREVPIDLVKIARERIEPYGLGIEILDARVALIAPPEEVKRAFDDVTRAQTGKETKLQNAEQDRATRVAAARAEAASIMKAGSGYAYRQRELARGNALAFWLRLEKMLAAIQTNPAYLTQVWLEQRSQLLRRLQESGQLGLLDEMLSPTAPPGQMGSPAGLPE